MAAAAILPEYGVINKRLSEHADGEGIECTFAGKSLKHRVMAEKVKHPGYLLSVMTGKCPRCREGHIYKEKNAYKLSSVVKMNERCPVCGQLTDIEVGFYYGTGFVSYGLAVLLSAISFLAWLFVFGFSLEDNRFFWWLGCNALLLIILQPPMMRLSRTLWLSWFVSYDPDWKQHPPDDASNERVIREQMDNW